MTVFLLWKMVLFVMYTRNEIWNLPNINTNRKAGKLWKERATTTTQCGSRRRLCCQFHCFAAIRQKTSDLWWFQTEANSWFRWWEGEHILVDVWALPAITAKRFQPFFGDQGNPSIEWIYGSGHQLVKILVSWLVKLPLNLSTKKEPIDPYQQINVQPL